MCTTVRKWPSPSWISRAIRLRSSARASCSAWTACAVSRAFAAASSATNRSLSRRARCSRSAIRENTNTNAIPEPNAISAWTSALHSESRAANASSATAAAATVTPALARAPRCSTPTLTTASSIIDA